MFYIIIDVLSHHYDLVFHDFCPENLNDLLCRNYDILRHDYKSKLIKNYFNLKKYDFLSHYNLASHIFYF